MRHFKDPKFKPLYDVLPPRVRDLADKDYALLKQNTKHPSPRFRRIKDNLWSVRVGRSHPALAIVGTDGFQW